jgi:hypothetical protein
VVQSLEARIERGEASVNEAHAASCGCT